MSWKDRLKTGLQLTSPLGDVYTANWIGNDRSKDKKIGRFDPPNFVGSIIQDLGINASTYPLTLHFSGDDHDLISDNFYLSCNQTGVWEIIHPTQGKLSLQLLSVSQQIRPVESGNITVFETEWIEPTQEQKEKSVIQLSSEIDAQILEVNSSASDQYVDNISTDNASAIVENKKTILSTLINANNAYKNIIALNNTITKEMLSIKNSINETINSATLAPASLAGQMQLLIQLPILATSDIFERIKACIGFNDNQISLLPTGSDIKSKNIVNAIELTLCASLAAMCKSIITGELLTRNETIDFINIIINEIEKITENLDYVQDNFNSVSIDKQYFSNSSSYAELLKLAGYTINYLLKSILNLKIEKSFILDRPRCPIEITIAEYGSLGEDDINLDFFIDSNYLIGSEIRILPAGKKVFVYV
jgi:prophage DNA circulation protein